jgi:predicted RNA-binding Zn ribbon-like protein
LTFTHDVEHALESVVDLVNTDPAATGAEQLTGIPSLANFVHRHAVSEIGRLTHADLEAVRGIRIPLRAVFTSRSPAEAAELLNGFLNKFTVTPRLTNHDSYDWHVHYFAPGASVADHLAADCGMALAFFVVAGEQERLRRCEAPDCRRAFVDLSRNRSRRYCDSRTCGNRLHVAAYRARRKEAAG